MAQIDKVICLSLDKRKSMVERLRKEISDYLNMSMESYWGGDGSDSEIPYDHIDVPLKSIERFQVIPPFNSLAGHINAFLCHRKMFELARMYNRVLFLEDDAHIIPARWKHIYPKIENQIPLYDCLFLGWQCREYPDDSDDMNRVEKEWAELSSFGIEDVGLRPLSGLHGVVMSRRFIDLLLDNCKIGPVDSFIQALNKWQAANGVAYKVGYVFPKIIGALESFSYAENRWQTRSHLE